MLIKNKNHMCYILYILLVLFSLFNCRNDNFQPENTNVSVEIIQESIPLFKGRYNNGVIYLKFTIDSSEKPLNLNTIDFQFQKGSNLEGIEIISVIHSSSVSGNQETELGKARIENESAMLKSNLEMRNGIHFIKLNIRLKDNCLLSDEFQLSAIQISFANHEDIIVTPSFKFSYRLSLVLRSQGQDNCDTYKIPGLITTNRNTLIAVYDNRYNNSKDLQEDIDIGMSRSTDGGQTWEPMRVIMDMGEYGGFTQNQNGIGDPSILFDEKTNTIWVAALWLSGASSDKMVWWASKPGMNPEETGQFILVKSQDDGITWSQPVNITSQIKKPEWQLLLQGPGRGITMKNGTIVFPAQYKADIGYKALDGGQFTCHSTIVYSKDHGNTWEIGTGAKSNTTESAVVELSDGNLMLNMRDDRNRSDKGENNGRAVAVSSDLGKTWAAHSSSNSALPKSNCMASLISANLKIHGSEHHVLFFSNPANKTERTDMTLKASLDDGNTWSGKFQILLNSGKSYGYSCLTMCDSVTVGILYEGTKELYFQKIKVSEIFSN